MKNKVPSFLLEKPASDFFIPGRGDLKISFIEKGIHHLAEVIKTGYLQWETSSRDHFFQKIDARVKVLFLLFYVVIVSLKKNISSEVLIGTFVFLLTILSGLEIKNLYKRVLFFTFIFGFLIALPSALNLITKGEIILPLLHLSRPYRFWVYQIPEEIGLSWEGIYALLMLTLRVMNSLTISFLVLQTTPFTEIIKALKIFKVPDSFLMIIILAYKYVFIFAKTIEDMHLAMKSRLVVKVGNTEARRWIAGRLAFLFKKTRLRCEEIFKAMLGRGFSNDIKFYGVGKLQTRDWLTGAALFLLGVLFLWI